MNSILTLVIEFLKIGMFTFGGGYAMIPMIQEVVIDTHQWMTLEEFVDIIAIAESTPGVIAVNMATFLGTQITGSPLGGIITSIAVVLPSFIIVLIVTHYYYKFKDSKYLENPLALIRLGIPGIIATAIVTLSQGILADVVSLIILATSIFLSIGKKVNPIIIIVLAGLAGAIIY